MFQGYLCNRTMGKPWQRRVTFHQATAAATASVTGNKPEALLQFIYFSINVTFYTY